MKNICVKLSQRENKKYRKMLSSEEMIFPEFDPESASTSPYTPGATLQDDDWFCITNAKEQEYSIDLLSEAVSTADLDSLTRAEFNKIDYLFVIDDRFIFFQNVSKSKLVSQKRIVHFGEGFTYLIPFPAFYAVPFKLLLPLDFLRRQFRGRQFKPPDEIQVNLYLLHPIPVNLLRRMDNNFVNKLVDHRGGQLGKVSVFLCQRKELRRTVGIFLKSGYLLFGLRNRYLKRFLFRFILCQQAVKAIFRNAPDSKGFVELFDDGIQLGNALFAFAELPLGFLCCFRLPYPGSGAHLFHKFILISDSKGAGCTDGFQNQLPDRFCPDIVAAASAGTLLVCQRIGGAVKEV